MRAHGARRRGRRAGRGLRRRRHGRVHRRCREGHHYFLEMNTRLQVEHPVTECITGQDLVEWQLRVAAGEPLPLRRTTSCCPAMPSRCACTPKTPTPASRRRPGACATGGGRWRPRPGPGCVWRVRIDAGIREGGEVTPYYDPMVAKLIAHGRDRDDAIRRLMARAGRCAAAGPAPQRPLPARPAGPPGLPRRRACTPR
jgi:acetyl/propionyl-CoA carboxylase alpha subunit